MRTHTNYVLRTHTCPNNNRVVFFFFASLRREPRRRNLSSKLVVENRWLKTNRRVLLDVEASLNESALTLVNAGQPCLRIIFDLKAELQKKKADWRLELGLGALQAFGLGGQVWQQ